MDKQPSAQATRCSSNEAGTLILSQSGGANSLAATSAIDVQKGTVAGVNDATHNAFSSASISLNGGNLTLSASAGSSAAFDSAIAANESGEIHAAQVTGGLAGQTVTLGGTKSFTIATDKTVILRTLDGYTMNVAGPASGDGTLSIGDGAKVNLTGSVTTKYVGFRGDISNVGVGGGVVPGEAFRFVPVATTPDMNATFAMGGGAGVVLEGEVNGSLRLSNSSNSYTGTTRILRRR